jgi:hypothetical protein
MTQRFKQWKVSPYAKLSQIDDGVLTVVGRIHMPLTELSRRMTVVRLIDSRLVVFSAIALDEDEMAALEAYGLCGSTLLLQVGSMARCPTHRRNRKARKARIVER